MPDGQNFDFGFPVAPNLPDPPTMVSPPGSWPETIVDQYRVMLADPDGNIVGRPAPAPLMRILSTSRDLTRSF